MIRTQLLQLFCIPVLFLSACASVTPESIPNQQTESAQNISSSTLADTNMAVLKISRAGTLRDNLNARILVDGEEVGRLKNDEYLSITVTPGAHEIKLKFRPASLQQGASFSLEAQAGQTYVYSIKSFSSGVSAGSKTSTFRFDETSEELLEACCKLIDGYKAASL